MISGGTGRDWIGLVGGRGKVGREREKDRKREREEEGGGWMVGV